MKSDKVYKQLHGRTEVLSHPLSDNELINQFSNEQKWLCGRIILNLITYFVWMTMQITSFAR